jgi:hypothetical protein
VVIDVATHGSERIRRLPSTRARQRGSGAPLKDRRRPLVAVAVRSRQGSVRSRPRWLSPRPKDGGIARTSGNGWSPISRTGC